MSDVSINNSIEADTTTRAEWLEGPYGYPGCSRCKRFSYFPLPVCPHCGAVMEDKNGVGTSV